jgi:hypothetical protein
MSDKNLHVLSDVSGRAGKTYKHNISKFAIG